MGDAGSTLTLRELNRLRVVDALRRTGSASRSDLARLTGLSRTTVAALVTDLQASGLVVGLDDDEPGGSGTHGRGRPPVLLRLDASAGAVLGLDFDHDHVRVAVADLSSTVLAERSAEIDVDNDATGALDIAADLVRDVLDDAGIERDRVVAAGMGLAGPIDRRTGTVGSSAILPGWAGLQPGRELAQKLGVQVQVDNDANLGAVGEVTFGAGVGLRDVVYVRLGSGVGAGLVLDGRLYTGATGIAGELGHVTVRQDGEVCGCGNRGCLQTVTAVPALLAMLSVPHGRPLGVLDLLELVAVGDPGARRVVHDAGLAVGRALADLCNTINPEAIIVGGELSAAGEPLLDGITQAVGRYALPAAAEAVAVRPGTLGDRAEVLGALALVIGDTERLRSAGLVALREAAVPHVAS